MNLNDLPVGLEMTIPEEYLDFLGHMNVMYYTHLFDRATWAFYDQFGFGREYHTQSGFGSFALEGHARYLSEVRVGQKVRLRTRLIARSDKLMHAMHFMEKEDGTLAATSEFLGVHIDLSTRRSAPYPPQVAAGLDALLAKHRALGWDAPLSGAIGVGKKNAAGGHAALG
ncbi:MAG: thioesterase [Anaerolineae bacterium]|nr:MAG: thioesterase [Anaerolineae bacterium]